MSDQTQEKPSLDTLLNNDTCKMIESMAQRFHEGNAAKIGRNHPMITQKDLAGEGYVGATVAYQSFDPSLASSPDMVQAFRTYAYPYIKNAMSKYCKCYGHPLSISEKSTRFDLEHINSIGVIRIDRGADDTTYNGDHVHNKFDIPEASGTNPFAEIEGEADVDDYLFLGLSDFERKLVVDHVVNEMTLRKISSDNNISPDRVRTIVRDALARMHDRAMRYL